MSTQTTTGRTNISPDDAIRFGFYNSNNKSRLQYDSWDQSWQYFDNKEYIAGFEKIFYYLLDGKESNLQYEVKGDTITFEMYQGSAKLNGYFDGENFHATALITKLEKASPVIMRKLLDRNQGLLYCRIALDNDNNIVAMMNSVAEILTPNTIHYGLREVLLLADELDDNLVNNFGTAVTFSGDMKLPVSENEASVKYRYFKKWISETLALLSAANRTHLQGIATYLPLTLIHRINYLCATKGIVEEKLSAINNFYWQNMQSKQPSNLAAVLQKMTQLIEDLNGISEQDFYACIYRTRDSFSAKGPIRQKEMSEIVTYTTDEAQDTYKRSSPAHASYVVEYAIGNIVNDFNAPFIFTELYHLQMMLMHHDFFEALGIALPLFSDDEHHPNQNFIKQYIADATDRYSDLYRDIFFDVAALDFKDTYSLCLSIATATEKMIATIH